MAQAGGAHEQLRVGAPVVLTGLVSTPQLNGAQGEVMGPAVPGSAPPRWPVRLLAPASVVAAFPDGVRAKAENLVVLREDTPPPAAAVQTRGAAAVKQEPAAVGVKQEVKQEVGSTPGAATGPVPASATKAKPKQKQGRGGGGRGAAGDAAAAPPTPPPAPAAGGPANRGGGLGLDLATRRGLAEQMVQKFDEALAADMYPMEAIEGVFGVAMDNSGRSSGFDLAGWKTGALVFGAWITVRNWWLEDRVDEKRQAAMEVEGEDDDPDADWEREKAWLQELQVQWRQELAEQLLAGGLPGWFGRQLVALGEGGQASGYSQELVRRGLRDIPWDTQLLERLAGR